MAVIDDAKQPSNHTTSQSPGPHFSFEIQQQNALDLATSGAVSVRPDPIIMKDIDLFGKPPIKK